jgi:hypothetical protein
MAKMMRLAGALDKTAKETRLKGSTTLSIESAAVQVLATEQWLALLVYFEHSEGLSKEMHSHPL